MCEDIKHKSSGKCAEENVQQSPLAEGQLAQSPWGGDVENEGAVSSSAPSSSRRLISWDIATVTWNFYFVLLRTFKTEENCVRKHNRLKILNHRCKTQAFGRMDRRVGK